MFPETSPSRVVRPAASPVRVVLPVASPVRLGRAPCSLPLPGLCSASRSLGRALLRAASFAPGSSQDPAAFPGWGRPAATLSLSEALSEIRILPWFPTPCCRPSTECDESSTQTDARGTGKEKALGKEKRDM